MGEPRGFLVVPIGTNPSGDLRSLEVDADDALIVALSSAAKGLVGPHGWISGAWQKQGMPLSYSDRIFETHITTSIIAGTYYVNGNVVPAGELWRYETVAVLHDDPVARLCILNAYDGATIVQMAISGALAQYTSIAPAGPITLKPGDKLYGQVNGLALNQSVWLYAWGYRIDIDQ